MLNVMNKENFKVQLEEIGFSGPLKSGKDFLNSIEKGYRKAVTLANDSANNKVQLEKKWTHKNGKAKHIVNPHRSYSVFRDIILAPHIQKHLEYLFPNKSVYVTHSKLSFKMSGLKQEWFPHQDSAYKIHNATGYTVAVLLEKCDESNGTILVYPRSHSKGKLKHKIVFAEEEKEPQIKVERMPNTTPCPINGNEGDVFFFDLDTIHSSGVNKAGGYRCILIFEVEECTKFPLEADGKDALYWNFSDRNLVATPFDNIRRTRLFVQNNIVGPVIKKILYFVMRQGS